VNNFTCVCSSGYNNVVNKEYCAPDCGNNITEVGGCDDGNIIPGDGCAANCTV